MLLAVLTLLLIASRVIAQSVTNQTQTKTDPEHLNKIITETIGETYPKEVFPTGNKEPKIIKTTPSTTQAPKSSPAASEWLIGLSAKEFIYLKESTNNPSAKNSGGCYGLGQDCNGIVEALCGADYLCQDTFFTNYMLRRYGTWENAKAFWLQKLVETGSGWW